ncbi:MAG: endolytic transglycosylase MltG [Pseudomonadota bacterium]
MGRTRTLMLLLAVAAVVLGWAGRQVLGTATTPGPATTEQRVIVAPGSSLRTVLAQLADQGLLTHPRVLELYLRCCHRETPGAPTDIKAGSYRFEPGLAPLAILTQLQQGKVVLEQITIVEGWSFAQMRAAIAAHPDVGQTLKTGSDADVMAAMGVPQLGPEGRFAPDTYRFAAGTPDEQLYRLAFDAQRRNLDEAWQSRQSDLPLENAEQALVLASIVEKETGLASERARVAGVFINRLRQGMRLQSDPTVIYGIRDRYDGDIRNRDLTTDTPYNTYTRAGLPPTPIALPGKDAIWATLHPEQTDAVFFVAIGDGTGGHYFSATLDEHNRAVRRYLDRLKRAGEAP